MQNLPSQCLQRGGGQGFAPHPRKYGPCRCLAKYCTAKLCQMLQYYAFLREADLLQNGWIFGKVQKGGGSFSIQKFILQIVANIDDTSVMNFAKICNMIFRKWGGVSKAVWNLSENSSVLEEVGFPKYCAAMPGKILDHSALLFLVRFPNLIYVSWGTRLNIWALPRTLTFTQVKPISNKYENLPKECVNRDIFCSWRRCA